MSKEAIKQALEALTFAYNGVEDEWLQDKIFAADTALRAAMEAAEKQEPVAWMHVDAHMPSNRHLEWQEQRKGYHGDWIKQPLYTTPPAAKAPPMPNWISYDAESDVLTIHNKRYAAAMFGEQGFSSPAGTLLRIEQGQPDRVTVTSVQRQPLTPNQLAKMLAEVGADPDQPGDWQLEFARAIEQAHGIKEQA